MANLDEWITHSNKDRLCGYKGRSPLLRLPDFDIIADISIEYMHLLALGVFKKMFLLSTKSRHNQSYRVPLKKGREFVAKWVPKQRLPACFPRRARADFAHYKASEWRTLGLQLFPIVIHALGAEELKHLRRAWLLLVFLSRTCLLDEQDLQNVEQALRVSGSSLEEIGASFLENFKISFGESQISYNVHIVGDHLALIRRRRPLHEASAFPFESSYGVLLRSFAIGTSSVGKQALSNVLLCATTGTHNCKKTVNFLPGSTGSMVTRDDLVQGFDRKFYKLDTTSEIQDATRCKAWEVILQDYRPKYCPLELPSFSLVGVHRYRGLCQNHVTLNLLEDIMTTAVLIEFGGAKVITSVPFNCLNDC